MKRQAFTLVEVLLAMTVVGIIAVVTMNSLGNISANKTKSAFQNSYKHMTEVLNAIVTDETVYPVIATDDYDDMGKIERVTMCNYDSTMFPREFVNHTKVTSQSAITGGFSFDTSAGSYWVVVKNPSISSCSTPSVKFVNSDYHIIFDVNGLAEGTNCPYTGSNLDTPVNGTCSAPDTFRFGVTADGKIVFDDQANVYKSKSLRNYLSQEHFLSTNY